MLSPSRNAFYNIVCFEIGGLFSRSEINSNVLLLLRTISPMILCPMMPRFIISMRELYDRDSRGGWNGIDSGFGVNISIDIADMSAIAFTEVAPGQDEIVEADPEDPEATQSQFEAVDDNDDARWV